MHYKFVLKFKGKILYFKKSDLLRYLRNKLNYYLLNF